MKLAIMVMFGTMAIITLLGLISAAFVFEIAKEDMEVLHENWTRFD